MIKSSKHKPMTALEREAFLDTHIRYRLDAIGLCLEAVELLREKRPLHVTTITFGTVKTIRFKNVRGVTNGFVEHGIMSCRAMLEFLGIGLNQTKNGLTQLSNRHPDTVTLRDFARPLLTVADVKAHLSNNRTIIDALVKTIRAAHKGCAHLTRGGNDLTQHELAVACRVTRNLVEQFLYRAIGRPAPDRVSPLRDDDSVYGVTNV